MSYGDITARGGFLARGVQSIENMLLDVHGSLPPEGTMSDVPIGSFRHELTALGKR